MANIVTVSGMFGDNKTYFADNPVVITISGLAWPGTSPFNIVRVQVRDSNGNAVGDFPMDTGGQSSISLDISTALQALWADIDFDGEVAAARTARGGTQSSHQRSYRTYTLYITTEYLASDGVFTTTVCEDENGNTSIPGGQCLIGGRTEYERSMITDSSKRDVSALQHTGIRNGDASTKPTGSPERVGAGSITSWVDVESTYTKTIFYPADAVAEPDDYPGSALSGAWNGHVPVVLRDSQDYVDFLFVNRRGAVETCSGQALEAMGIDVATDQYSRVERPAFSPSRSLMNISSGGRRSWSMSSGYQTREWAEWWVLEFLMARQWWMLYNGSYVPVTVKPSRSSMGIYDRSKQQLPHVDFTVTLALEG